MPLAILLLGVATLGAGLVVAFVIVPVANYGLPMLIVVGVGAVTVGRLIARWRKREAARYPPPIV